MEVDGTSLGSIELEDNENHWPAAADEESYETLSRVPVTTVANEQSMTC